MYLGEANTWKVYPGFSLEDSKDTLTRYTLKGKASSNLFPY